MTVWRLAQEGDVEEWKGNKKKRRKGKRERKE